MHFETGAEPGSCWWYSSKNSKHGQDEFRGLLSPGAAGVSWRLEVRPWKPPKTDVWRGSLGTRGSPSRSTQCFSFWLEFQSPSLTQFLDHSNESPWYWYWQQTSRRRWVSISPLFWRVILKLFPNQLHLSFQAPGRSCPGAGEDSNCKTKFPCCLVKPRDQLLLPASPTAPPCHLSLQQRCLGAVFTASLQTFLHDSIWKSSSWQPTPGAGTGFPSFLLPFKRGLMAFTSKVSQESESEAESPGS
jgi:hypothetical protein